MNWVAILIIYCVFSILAFIYIRRRANRTVKTDFVFWSVMFLILPFAIVSLPIWFPYALIKKQKTNVQMRIWRDEHERWMKEYKARSIISGAERNDSGIETLYTYKCKNCGYTLRSMPQGFYKISSGVYYNFKCENCKIVVGVHSKDVYSNYCPKCEEHNCLAFWNPIEGHCPKCDGMMEVISDISTNN